MKKCFKCGSSRCVKNGVVFGLQRYKCKDCGYQFTRSAPAGKPLYLKLLTHTLYIAGFSMRQIALIVGTTAQSISRWIKKWHTTYIEEVGEHQNICKIEGNIADYIDITDSKECILLHNILPTGAEVYLVVKLPK